MATNQAAYLDGIGQKIRIGPAELPKAKDNEIVIRNHAVAVNPLDWKQQDLGVLVQTWPTIPGVDIAGEVVDVGTDVRDLKKGDRVIASTSTLKSQDLRHGGYQLYAAVTSDRASKIPEGTSYNEGVVLPVAFDTAIWALFGPDDSLHLPHPSYEPKPSGKTVVVWGGSSSVGALAVQLLIAAGVKVVTTASPHNFDFCRRNGASEVLDYKKESVDDDVIRAVRAAGGEFAGIFDTISIADQSYEHVFAIAEKLGGGTVITTVPGPDKVPGNVKTSKVLGEKSTLGHSLRKTFLGAALETGQIKALPEALVVGTGLEAIQVGFDRGRKGVSARKIVIEL